MFTPCPSCGRNIRDGLDVPTGSLHRCIVQNGRGRYRFNRGAPYSPSGQMRECLCGATVHQAADGAKCNADGSPHVCHKQPSNGQPHPETAEQLARGFAPPTRIRPKPPADPEVRDETPKAKRIDRALW